MLHVTNGDGAAGQIRRAGVPGGLVLPWRDVLHEGPVPAGLPDDALRAVRAGFIAACGWASAEAAEADFARRDETVARAGEHEETVLWFEHDLYDQLQLIQLLDRLAVPGRSATRLTLINPARYLGAVEPAALARLFDARREVTPAQIALGRAAWAAFRAPEPTRIADLLDRDTSALPFLAPALERHLRQFPSTRNGLSRTEQLALETLAAGEAPAARLYVASHHEREEAIFLGDAGFALYLEAMSRPAPPLLVLDDGRPIEAADRLSDGFWQRRVRATGAGSRVLAGEADRIALHGLDRWLGGVHLSGRPGWRWDAVRGRLAVA